LCKPGSDVLLVWCQKGQNKDSVSKARARITSHSTGLRYAQPVNSSVMQNREVQKPKTKPGLDDSRVRGYSVSWVVLLSGYFSGWVLKQARDGGNFILSVSLNRPGFCGGSNL
jgi:hypothetical protein